MQEIAQKFAEYGYLIVFFYSIGGGMLALAALGALSAQEPAISASAAIALAAAANFAGAFAPYYLAASSREQIAPRLRPHRRKIALLVLYFRRGGFWWLLGCKFLYGFKTIAPAAAQIASMSAARFAVFNALGAVVWAFAVFFVARAGGEVIASAIGASQTAVLAGGFVLAAAALWWLLGRLAAKRVGGAVGAVGDGDCGVGATGKSGESVGGKSNEGGAR